MVKKRKSWINIRDIAWLKAQVYKIRRNRQSFKIESNKHGYHIVQLGFGPKMNTKLTLETTHHHPKLLEGF